MCALSRSTHKVKKMIRKISLIVFLVAFVWFAWLIYQFFAYEGEVPMLLSKDLALPGHTPKTTPFSAHPQSSAALDLLAQHKTTIHAPAISAAVAVDGKIVWA